uniref:Core-binding factor subunit beta n=1 Tax=Meleagris gallopavo TaxID=9103 RepID=A0A803XLM8_MELGA
MILNGVCVIWKGWIDLQRLDGMGCLEFDEERAQLTADVDPHVMLVSVGSGASSCAVQCLQCSCFCHQEDALAQQAFEEARRRTREFEDRDRSHREEMEVRVSQLLSVTGKKTTRP